MIKIDIYPDENCNACRFAQDLYDDYRLRCCINDMVVDDYAMENAKHPDCPVEEI